MADPSVTFLSLALTTTDQAAQIYNEEDIVWEDVNIHVYGNPVYYGNGLLVQRATQNAPTPDCSNAVAGSVISFQKFRNKDIFFKSFNAGAAAVIIASGAIRV